MEARERVHKLVRKRGHHRRHGGDAWELSFVLRGGGLRFPFALNYNNASQAKHKSIIHF